MNMPCMGCRKRRKEKEAKRKAQFEKDKARWARQKEQQKRK